MYEGEFKDNMYHGTGKFLYSNGDVYLGDWQDNAYHGKGVLSYQNSDKYDGEYRFGKACGYGIYSYASGDRYEGEFVVTSIELFCASWQFIELISPVTLGRQV